MGGCGEERLGGGGGGQEGKQPAMGACRQWVSDGARQGGSG